MSNISITIEIETTEKSDARLPEVAAYLRYLKQVGLKKPVVSDDSTELALSIVKGLGDIQNIGMTQKHRPLFSGGKTFHRNDITGMTQFFENNKAHLLAVVEHIVKSKLKGCHLTFATGLANGFKLIDDVAAAYSSLNSRSAKSSLSEKQSLLRKTMIANLLEQVLHHVEQEINSQQAQAA